MRGCARSVNGRAAAGTRVPVGYPGNDLPGNGSPSERRLTVLKQELIRR